MQLCVLGAGPRRPMIRAARHVPPPFINHMLAMKMGNLAWPLAGEQDHPQWRAEMGPERDDLGVTEHALATRRIVLLHAGARVRSDDLLPYRPAEDRAGRSKNLVSQDGGCDGCNGSLDVCPLDAADVQLGPPWQQMRANQVVGLPPALVPLPSVFLDVAGGRLLERPLPRNASRSACGSPPSATATMILPTSLRASASEIALALPR